MHRHQQRTICREIVTRLEQNEHAMHRLATHASTEAAQAVVISRAQHDLMWCWKMAPQVCRDLGPEILEAVQGRLLEAMASLKGQEDADA